MCASHRCIYQLQRFSCVSTFINLPGRHTHLLICCFNTIIHANLFILLYSPICKPFYIHSLYTCEPTWGVIKIYNKIYQFSRKIIKKKNVKRRWDDLTWTPSWNVAPPAALSNLQTCRRQSWSGRWCTGRNHSKRRTRWPSSGRLDKECRAAIQTCLQSSFPCPGLQWCGCCSALLQKSANVILNLLKCYFRFIDHLLILVMKPVCSSVLSVDNSVLLHKSLKKTGENFKSKYPSGSFHGLLVLLRKPCQHFSLKPPWQSEERQETEDEQC